MARMTPRRKLAIATWDAPREGNIFGKLTVDATQALAYIAHLRETTGEKVTITHLVGKAVAMALKEAPGLNGLIRFGAFVPHKTVDIAFLVTLEGGKNLAKAKIERLDEKPVTEVAKELRAMAEKLRSGQDEAFKKSMGPVGCLPTWLIRPLLNVTGFITSCLGIGFGPLGLESFPFGSCVVTNVGAFGLDEAFVPQVPFARVPLWVLVGMIHDAVAFKEDGLGVRKELTISATIDHRFIDGFQGGILAKVTRELLENPWKLDGMEGPPEAKPEPEAEAKSEAKPESEAKSESETESSLG